MNKKDYYLLPNHLQQLHDSQWAIWRVLLLRGAGFPAKLVDELADSVCSNTIDRLLLAEKEAKKLILSTIVLSLESLQRNETRYFEQILLVKQALEQDKLPKNINNWLKTIEHSPVKEAIKIYDFKLTEISKEWEDLSICFSAKTLERSKFIREVAQNNQFREALIWQNRRLLNRGINSLIHKNPDNHSRNSKHRSNEQLVAMYLQRYCVKNDQIGFFGPTGFANLVAQPESLTVLPGNSLLSSRNIGFEAWCIESLADKLSQNSDLFPWIAPRCLPYIRVDKETLYIPMQSPTQISTAHAAILQACNGENLAIDIADKILSLFSHELEKPEDVYQILAHFQSLEMIVWKLEIPIHPNAEQVLRRQLERIRDNNLQQEALAPLNRLENAREKIICAVGEPEKLDIAIADLEKTFTQLTDVASTRADGETYVGRTLVYEDCVRNIKVELGETFVQELEKPLLLLLDSARWMTFQAATVCRQAFQSIYSQITSKNNSQIVDALDFWHQVEPILLDEETRPFNNLISEFQQHWEKILAISPGQRHITYTSEELHDKVLEVFDAPLAGWHSARYHSFDLMIDAPSIEAIHQGNYQVILGELHIALNPLLTSSNYLKHPYPKQLLGYYKQDIPEPLLIAVPSKDWPGLTTRTSFIHLLPKDYCLALFSDAHGFPISNILTIGELVVEDNSQGLVIRTRDGKLQFDIIEAFAEALFTIVVNSFNVSNRNSRYLPRITIDNLVIQRETWSYLPSEIPFAFGKNELDRFVEARRWLQDHDLPRHVFVKVAIEAKPFYVDFDSPIYVDIVAKTIRRCLESNLKELPVRFSEMLPTHDGLWLIDAEGQHYTSELRMVALDLAGRSNL